MSETLRLSDYLADAKISLEQIDATFPSQQFLPTRLLGAEPLSSCYAGINPPTMEIRDAMIPAFLHIPFCDLGMGVDPSLRACVMFTASRAMGCAYCQAHCVGIGTLGAGANLFIDKVGKTVNMHTEKDTFTAAEIAAMEMAHAVGSVPATVTLQHRINLARHFPDNLIEPVVFPAILMAWLTRFMDTVGTPLEGPAFETANLVKNQIGWSPGKHVNLEKDQERMDAEIERRDEKGAGNPILKRLNLLRHVIAAKIADAKFKKGLPNKIPVLESYMVDLLGFAPYYLSNTADSGMRSALSLMIVKGLAQEQHSNIPLSLKWRICYLQACCVGSAILQAHFALLSTKTGATLEELAKIRRSDFSSFNDLVQSVLKFAELSAGPAPFAMDKEQMERLVELFKPAEIIELIATVSYFSVLRAVTAAFPPVGYEKNVKEFVEQEDVKSLVDFVDEWDDWDALVEKALEEEKAANPLNEENSLAEAADENTRKLGSSGEVGDVLKSTTASAKEATTAVRDEAVRSSEKLTMETLDSVEALKLNAAEKAEETAATISSVMSEVAGGKADDAHAQPEPAGKLAN